MRRRSLVLILAVYAVAVGLSAADNAFMGTWKLNEAKSKIPAGRAGTRPWCTIRPVMNLR